LFGELTDLSVLASDYDSCCDGEHNDVRIKSMDLQKFESQYRDAMAETLNELQTAVLLLAQVQRKIDLIGSSVQGLSQSVEDYIIQQKPQ
jgi:hypothetical protein